MGTHHHIKAKFQMALSLMFPEFRPFVAHRPAFSRSAIRLVEDDDGYKLSAHVPGVAASGVQVKVTNDTQLHVVARSNENEKLLNRTLALPDDADPSTLRASCVDGVLEVQIDKLAVPTPVEITVQATSPMALEDPESAYEFKRSIPGIPASTVKVQIEEGSTVNIEAKSQGFGSYTYKFTLPEHADAATITAYCANGILTIRMPRKPLPEPIGITVAPIAPMEADVDVTTTHVTLATLRVPGYSADDIKLKAHEGRLSIELLRNGDTAAAYWVLLPEDLNDPRNLVAVCQDGILNLKYPTGEIQQPVARTVEVSATRAENLLAADDDDDMQQ